MAPLPVVPERGRGEVRYPFARHSPLTRGVVSGLRAVLERSKGRRDVFAKIGDSITYSGFFLGCLGGDDIRWGEHGGLEETRAFFSKTTIGEDGRTSFTRQSKASAVGWRTIKLLEGAPRYAKELKVIDPALAVVLLGTNDTWPDIMPSYHRDLRRLIDELLGRGVVPLVSTLPPRRDSLQARELTLEMNAVIQAVAQSRQVPLMDLFGALDDLPRAGLNKDGVHPDALIEGRGRPCWFDEKGLRYGMNQRNLLTLEALDRVRRKVLGDEAPDPDPLPLDGDGSWEHPFEVAQIPFVDTNTTRGGQERAGKYGCGKQAQEGPERVYRVRVARATKLRARVFSEDGVDVDLHWLTEPDAARCQARAGSKLDVVVKPGTYWLVVDTPSKGGAKPGKYGLSLLAAPQTG